VTAPGGVAKTGPGAMHRDQKAAALEARFAAGLLRKDVLGEGDRVVVALSGGVDSLTLLHLLRFGSGMPPLEMTAAHFDHGMRPGSENDALWVRGLCRAWAIPLHLGRVAEVPSSEDEAREARYHFLLDVMRQEAARCLLTGHQADDQAETILFRILRGTGLAGLGGIPRLRPPGIYRPLLSFTREEIESYAGIRGLRPLRDPTNTDTAIPRNFLRHRTLPDLEAGPTPGARRSLRRLARLARENEDGWRSILPHLLTGVLVEDESGVALDRDGLLALHPAVRSRVLREALSRAGVSLDEAGTRAALEFTRTGASGRSLDLPGGSLLSREFHRLLVRVREEPGQDLPLTIIRPEAGRGELVVGGRRFLVVWGGEKPTGCLRTHGVPRSGLHFPLHLRGWMQGDRILLHYGTKKLKKLLAEARVPAPDRSRIPVLVDGSGRVLWVMGVASSALLGSPEWGGENFYIGIRHVEGP
jgi:tRNA(Ile)-lysidine synthase